MKNIFNALLVFSCLLATGPHRAWAEVEKTIRGFADINFELNDAKGENSQFRLGEFDTYITGTLAERTSFLSEVTYKFRDEWIIGFERLWVRYVVNDYFRVSVGKFHTPLGFWNRTYHHGVLLYTSVDKPHLQKMIPIHTLGIRLSGREIGKARLYYALMVGNGIGSTEARDNDQTKSITLDVHSKVIEGFDVGISIYRDHASKGGVDESAIPHLAHFPSLTEDVDLWILLASAVVERGGIEILSEFALFNTEGKTSGRNSWSSGGYVMGSYAIGDYIPFVRLDHIKVKDEGLLFDATETNSLALGMNFHLSHLANLKVQYTRESPTGAENTNGFVAQLAIGF